MKTPVLTGVTGKIFGRIINRSGTNQPLNVMGNPIPYFPADSADNSGAVLKTILKETIDGVVTEGATIPNSAWKFCYGAGATFAAPGSPTALPVRVCLDGEPDLRPGEALSARIHGRRTRTCWAPAPRRSATCGSFFKYETEDDFGTANPLARPDQRGRSSAARRSRATSPGTSSTSA